jgi:hypothetical protein
MLTAYPKKGIAKNLHNLWGASSPHLRINSGKNCLTLEAFVYQGLLQGFPKRPISLRFPQGSPRKEILDID